MNAYVVPLTCPRCAGALDHVTNSRPIAGTQAQAIARCEPCRARWQILVHLRPAA